MLLSRSQFDAIVAVYSFSTAANFFLIINLYKFYHASRRELLVPSSRNLSLRTREGRIFLSLAIVHLLVTTIAEATFFTLFLWHRNIWLIFLLSSIVLMNMCRECLWAIGSWSCGQRTFRPLFIVGILVISWPCFLSGAILSGNYPTLSRYLISGSVILYRLWMVWEWAQMAAYAMKGRKNILFHLMAHILAFGASAAGTSLESHVNHLLIISYAFAIHGLIVCAFSVIQRWKRSFKRARRERVEGLSAESSTSIMLTDLTIAA